MSTSIYEPRKTILERRSKTVLLG
uniref:Uncharacterized protein n=1 Tax=Rhizophora mucronata TaxID=61149 RepID=A0A2P2QUT3_RHIMU